MLANTLKIVVNVGQTRILCLFVLFFIFLDFKRYAYDCDIWRKTTATVKGEQCNAELSFVPAKSALFFFFTYCFVSETPYNIYKHNTFYNTQVHAYVSHTTEYESLGIKL